MDFGDVTADDWGKLLVYGVLATYVAMTLPRLFRGNFIAALQTMIFWVVALFAVVAGYAYRFELRGVADRVLAAVVPGTAIETGDREVTVIRGPDGQFVVNGTVDGWLVPFVLDTGASTVVLRAEDAAKMKIPTRRLTYDIMVSTANGRTMTAETELAKLSIGTLSQTGVRALVARPGALTQNLLGMSFLNGLESFTISNDRLVMRGR